MYVEYLEKDELMAQFYRLPINPISRRANSQCIKIEALTFKDSLVVNRFFKRHQIKLSVIGNELLSRVTYELHNYLKNLK